MNLLKNRALETLRVRTISISFTLITLAVFKKCGLDLTDLTCYGHMVLILLLSLMTSQVADLTLKYLLRLPPSFDQGVSYILRRNLIFQLINTPLVALMLTFYFHYLLGDRIEDNSISWHNYLETLAIISFCAVLLGFYWRIHFRSRFLKMELRETRQMNEDLKRLQQEAIRRAEQAETTLSQQTVPEAVAPTSTPAPSHIVLTGTTNETVSLSVADLLYVEAVGNYVKVYHLRADGTVRSDMLRATSRQIETDLTAYPTIVRCHRAFLVNLQQVEQIVSQSGAMQLNIKHCQESIPVSRSNISQIKEALRKASL